MVELDGPTTVFLVLLSAAIVSSSRSRCALTRSGGVSASHCSASRPSAFSSPAPQTPKAEPRRCKKRQPNANETHLGQADVLEAVRVEDLEEVQRRVARVLDVVSEGRGHEADVPSLSAAAAASAGLSAHGFLRHQTAHHEAGVCKMWEA